MNHIDERLRSVKHEKGIADLVWKGQSRVPRFHVSSQKTK